MGQIIARAQEFSIWANVLMLTLLIFSALVAWRARRPKSDSHGKFDNALSIVVTGMILALSAEGMYVVLTTKIDQPLPTYLAVVTCAVVESLLVLLFREAKKFNDLHGRPGPYGKAFWLVAAVGGGIVAMSTTSMVEVTLRLALPLSVAMIHWIKLTAGKSKPSTITWLITPTRIAMRLGIVTGEEQTLSDAQRQRQIDRIVRLSYLYSSKKTGSRRARRSSAKLRKAILTTTPEMAQAAAAQIDLTYGMENMITGAVAAGRKRQYVGTDLLGIRDHQKDQEVLTITEAPQAPGPSVEEEITAAPDQLEILEVVETSPPQALPASKPGDAEIIAIYRDELESLYRAQELTRYRVEKLCGLSRRPALRVLALADQEFGSD